MLQTPAKLTWAKPGAASSRLASTATRPAQRIALNPVIHNSVQSAHTAPAIATLPPSVAGGSIADAADASPEPRTESMGPRLAALPRDARSGVDDARQHAERTERRARRCDVARRHADTRAPPRRCQPLAGVGGCEAVTRGDQLRCVGARVQRARLVEHGGDDSRERRSLR